MGEEVSGEAAQPDKRCETCACAIWGVDLVRDCDWEMEHWGEDPLPVEDWLMHQTGDCPGHTPTEVQDDE